MAGHSILYLGRGEFAADYLSELETLPFCTLLTRSAQLEVPDDAPSVLDIVLLEGWCLGVQAQAQDELESPINELEREEDVDGRWRQHVNQQISQEFEPLYRQVDRWVMLCAPSFDCVYSWRLEQEHKLAGQSDGDDNSIMSDSQVARFIQFYERLTRQCLGHLPDRVHHLYRLDSERQVTEEFHTVGLAS